MQTLTSITDLTERVLATLQDLGAQRRVVVGLVGEPGSGKSTVAQALAEDLGSHGAVTTVVPMDGFHLANVELARLGLAARKGAPDTFDALGYAALLHRLRTSTGETVYAPAFERSIEEAVAGSIPVLSETSVVVTEGNYLLVSEGTWTTDPARTGCVPGTCASVGPRRRPRRGSRPWTSRMPPSSDRRCRAPTSPSVSGSRHRVAGQGTAYDSFCVGGAVRITGGPRRGRGHS